MPMNVDKAIEAPGRVSEPSPHREARDAVGYGDPARIPPDDPVRALRPTRSGKPIPTK